MTTIYLTVTGAQATAQADGPITSGMMGLPVVISCDESWEGLTRTLVCRNSMGKPAQDQVYLLANVGSRATVAPEVMVAHRQLYLGIEGRSADGTLVIPTVWAECGVIQPGAESTGNESLEATPEVWAQLASQIGNLEELDTDSKGNLVAAVNALSQEARESHEDLSGAIADTRRLTQQNAANLTAARESLSGRIGTVRQELTADISALSQEAAASHEALSQQITQVQDQTNQNQTNLTTVRQELDAAIEDVHHQLSTDIDSLEDALHQFSTTVEPEDGDLPRVFLEGDLPTGQEESRATMTYISKTRRFSAFLTMSFLDDYSLNQDKKSLHIRMFSNASRTAALYKAFQDWGPGFNSYVLRANFTDHSHGRNLVSSRLWNEIMASRADYDSLPARLRESARNGAMDGFPVKVYWGGSYQGIYTWTTGTKRWNTHGENQGVLRALTNSTTETPETPCNFRALWSGTDGDHWAVESGDAAALATSLNQLISFVQTADDEAFRTGIGDYLDLQSAIDYYLLQYAICGIDALGKNLHLATYDGTKWFCGCGDLDATFLLTPSGSTFLPQSRRCPEDYQEPRSLLWERLELTFFQQMQQRYQQLRTNVLTFPNICTHFEYFVDAIGTDLYQEDVTIFPSIPLPDTNNIQQIRNAIQARLSYCDMTVDTLGQGSVKIDYTLNPLENVSWLDNSCYIGGVLSSRVDEHCTTPFMLQDCLYNVVCPGGSYQTLYIWDQEGNYLGQVENQVTYFTGNSNYQYAFRTYHANGFDPADVSIMPVDNEATATETVILDLAEQTYTSNGIAITANVHYLFNTGNATIDTIAAQIHHADAMITIGALYNNLTDVDPEKLKVVSLYASNRQVTLGTRLYGGVLEDATAYLAEHKPVIIING